MDFKSNRLIHWVLFSQDLNTTNKISEAFLREIGMKMDISLQPNKTDAKPLWQVLNINHIVHINKWIID